MSEHQVLIVDDEKEILKSFGRYLRKKFNLDTALSGPEALALVARNGPYAVVVTDYRMPLMDGFEFLKRIREISPDTIRIMITAYLDIDVAIRAVNEGHVFRFLTKPCPPEMLAEAMSQGIRYYELTLAEREYIDTKRWRKSLGEVVLAMVKLVETRDPYTAGHQQRVALLSTAMAEEMVLDQQQIESINMAATLHDVGKIYVPIDFLTKPGLLSTEEFNIIKLHPRAGFEILEPIDFQGPVAEMIYQHHERRDGSGYPRGLKNEEILLEAGIIAVADVVEAMCSHRPYRPGHDTGEALREIERGMGGLYEPDAARACLALFREKGFVFDDQP